MVSSAPGTGTWVARLQPSSAVVRCLSTSPMRTRSRPPQPACSKLDVLVNNAGISLDTGTRVTKTDVEVFRRTYETNVFGVVAVTNAFLPALRRSAHPRIVNVSSGTGSLTWSTGPNPQFDYQAAGTGSGAAYRSSKTALDALTVFYAQALAHDGFKVNALAPGLRATNLNPRAAPPAATQPKPRRAPSGSRCCRTMAPPASCSLGTGRSCHGENASGRRRAVTTHNSIGRRAVAGSIWERPRCRRPGREWRSRHSHRLVPCSRPPSGTVLLKAKVLAAASVGG